MYICQLHLYLCATCDRCRRIRWNPRQWEKDLSLPTDVVIEELVNILEGAGILTKSDGFLHLVPWPENQGNSERLLTKGEQLQEAAENHQALVAPHYLHLNSRMSRRCPVSKARVLQGVTWENIDRDFKLFIENFPVKKISPWAARNAYPYWQRLRFHNDLPSLQILMHLLQAHPPVKPYQTPLTWLRKRFWSQVSVKPEDICPSCLGEKVVYASLNDGSKGAIPCSVCKSTGTVKTDTPRHFIDRKKKP